MSECSRSRKVRDGVNARSEKALIQGQRMRECKFREL